MFKMWQRIFLKYAVHVIVDESGEWVILGRVVEKIDSQQE